MRVKPKKTRIEKHHIEDFLGRIYMSFCVLLLIVIIVSMVYFVASKGIANFISGEMKVSEFLFGSKWAPEADTPSYGALPFITGSFLVTLLAALIASPLSICAALFMTEIVPGWGKKLLQPVIELLSGIPSVVYGFVGLSVIVPFLRNTFPGQGIGVAAGALVLSVMILPTITSVAADALASLPQKFERILICARCHTVADNLPGNSSDYTAGHYDRGSTGDGPRVW